MQQPSETKVPGFCPSQRIAQLGSGSGYSVVIVEVTVVVEVFEVVVSVVTTAVVVGPVGFSSGGSKEIGQNLDNGSKNSENQ